MNETMGIVCVSFLSDKAWEMTAFLLVDRKLGRPRCGRLGGEEVVEFMCGCERRS